MGCDQHDADDNFAQGLVMIGPNRASLFNNLIPVFGTILSVLILRESLEPYHLIAAVIVVAGIALAEYAARRETSKQMDALFLLPLREKEER